MYNYTNDAEGPEVVREGFYERIEGLHYRLVSLDEVDRVLRDRMGITLGSQLELVTAGELAEELGADGLVYGFLLDFDDITTGVYNVKKVRAGFKLVEARTGRVLWARGRGVKSLVAGAEVGAAVTIIKEIGEAADDLPEIEGLQGIPGLRDWRIIRVIQTEKLEQAAILSLGEKLVTSIFGLHLRLETDVMLGGIVKSFPPGPGRMPRATEPPPSEEAR